MRNEILMNRLVPNDSDRKRFIDDFPDLLSFGIDMLVSSKQRKVLNSADYFEFHYRRYIVGRHQTLHRVLFEVRRFVEVDPNAAYHFITDSIDRCKAELLENEWYEALARHNKASAKIQVEVPDQQQSAPAVFVMINTNRGLLKPIFM